MARPRAVPDAQRSRASAPRATHAEAEDLDPFELLPSSDLSLGHVQARPGNLLVPVRNPYSLAHVAAAFQAAGDRDVVVMTARLVGVDMDELVSEETAPTPAERYLLSKVIALAERFGRSPELNLWIRTAPRGAEHFHWHVDIAPRLTVKAGFEMGTGVDINIYPPEKAAADLKECL